MWLLFSDCDFALVVVYRASSSSDSGFVCIEMSVGPLSCRDMHFPSCTLSLGIEAASRGYLRALFWACIGVLALFVALCVSFLGVLGDVSDYLYHFFYILVFPNDGEGSVVVASLYCVDVYAIDGLHFLHSFSSFTYYFCCYLCCCVEFCCC